MPRPVPIGSSWTHAPVITSVACRSAALPAPPCQRAVAVPKASPVVRCAAKADWSRRRTAARRPPAPRHAERLAAGGEEAQVRGAAQDAVGEDPHASSTCSQLSRRSRPAGRPTSGTTGRRGGARIRPAPRSWWRRPVGPSQGPRPVRVRRARHRPRAFGARRSRPDRQARLAHTAHPGERDGGASSPGHLHQIPSHGRNTVTRDQVIACRKPQA